ncbi:hypothetical protein EDB80DRAFT_688238 [Ilyonectria destructans]|nr:hypothetical protein EDB80DRAFT_688238 [Ilyonectria destructans]
MPVSDVPSRAMMEGRYMRRSACARSLPGAPSWRARYRYSGTGDSEPIDASAGSRGLRSEGSNRQGFSGRNGGGGGTSKTRCSSRALLISPGLVRLAKRARLATTCRRARAWALHRRWPGRTSLKRYLSSRPHMQGLEAVGRWFSKESGGRASRFEDPLLPVTGEGMREASREGSDQGLPPGQRAGSDPLVRLANVLPGGDTSDVVGPAVACCFVLPNGGRKVQRVAHSCMRQHGRQANQGPTETLDRLLIEETIHVFKYRYFDMCQVPAPAHPLLAHLFNVEVKVTMARPETCADSRLLLASWQERQHRIDASSPDAPSQPPGIREYQTLPSAGNRHTEHNPRQGPWAVPSSFAAPGPAEPHHHLPAAKQQAAANASLEHCQTRGILVYRRGYLTPVNPWGRQATHADWGWAAPWARAIRPLALGSRDARAGAYCKDSVFSRAHHSTGFHHEQDNLCQCTLFGALISVGGAVQPAVPPSHGVLGLAAAPASRGDRSAESGYTEITVSRGT